jgi:hypothetical protein
MPSAAPNNSVHVRLDVLPAYFLSTYYQPLFRFAKRLECDAPRRFDLANIN